MSRERVEGGGSSSVVGNTPSINNTNVKPNKTLCFLHFSPLPPSLIWRLWSHSHSLLSAFTPPNQFPNFIIYYPPPTLKHQNIRLLPCVCVDTVHPPSVGPFLINSWFIWITFICPHNSFLSLQINSVKVLHRKINQMEMDTLYEIQILI